jgi:hypothetical protein
VEAAPDILAITDWDVETIGPPAAILKNQALKMCVIELKSFVKVSPLEMGWMRVSR